ncbi:MAG: glutamate racemase [Eubacteriales bacterium]|nr:glutamate racemase [Eubacteriales bacterium]
MAKKTDPIAVFDSGMGGISVLREMVRLMPEEDFIYFGDSKNAPYGTKTLEEVRSLTLSNIKYLLEVHHAKAIAVACNTATSAAVRILRELYPEVPLVGVEPAIKPAVSCMDHPRVLVMATPYTLNGDKFKNLKEVYQEQAVIEPLPCPGLMEFVERGVLYGEDLEYFLHEKMDPFLKDGIDAIVLGCTHYPFVRDTIQRIAGDEVLLFDGSLGTARELRRRIHAAGLENDAEHKGNVTFLNSTGDPGRIRLSLTLFNM